MHVDVGCDPKKRVSGKDFTGVCACVLSEGNCVCVWGGAIKQLSPSMCVKFTCERQKQRRAREVRGQKGFP